MILSILTIIIALASIIVVIYLDYTNKKFVLKLKTDNESFVEKILADYLSMANNSKDSGISALIKARIQNPDLLTDEQKINYIISEIQKSTTSDPLGEHSIRITKIGLAKYFKEIDLESFKKNGGIEVIKKLENSN